ncbi:MAG TPA: hypothetical protein VK491_06300, partial [Gemmatimonadaceae bacterium]|nr:hypothetical protein [Gemmatimonadaceae bacterium]
MLTEILRFLNGKRATNTVSRHDVRGIPVVIDNTRPDIDTTDVIARLERTLELIERFVPHHFRHLERDFAYIVVQRF